MRCKFNVRWLTEGVWNYCFHLTDKEAIEMMRERLDNGASDAECFTMFTDDGAPERRVIAYQKAGV